jgi:hypothetical protein
MVGLLWVRDPPQETKTEKPKQEEDERRDGILSS